MLEEQKKYALLMKTAYDEYLNIYLYEDLKPKISLLKYDFEFVHSKYIGIAGNEMIEGDIREITNILNQWNNLLKRWYAWDKVLGQYQNDRQSEWELEAEFLNLIIDKCLFVPSRIKDVFINVGIQNFHQIRRSIDDSYKDEIIGYDPKLPDLKPIHLSRKKKEKVLERTLSFCDSDKLINKIKALNNHEYQKQLTNDYRNLSSHSIAPRLTEGFVSPVTRKIVKRTKMVQNANGSFNEVEVEGEKAVRYSFGGKEPLDRKKLYEANVDEFTKAIDCYNEFKSLLKQAILKIPNRSMD